MSLNVNIRDLGSLEQLRIAIARFCEDTENQLQAIDSKTQTRIGILKSQESQFQRKIEIAKDELRSSYISLSSCESNTYEDEDGNTVYPNCNNEKAELSQCKRQLQLAEHNYNTFKNEIAKLEVYIGEYQKPRIKYKTLLQYEKEAGTGSLKQLINGAEDYLVVASPFGNGMSNGLGLANAIAKIDPTMVLAATIGAGELMIMSMFSFISLGGKSYNISNANNKGLITSNIVENGTDHICSELKIGKNENGNFGQIVNVNIPSSLQNVKIGKYLINNMETTCRANDCKEISGWANSANVGFYKGLGYQTRNEIKDSGAEVYKSLDSSYNCTQYNAKATFQNVNEMNFKNINGNQEINPLYIISPDEINDEKFWKQHDRDGMERYIDQIERYDKCKQLLKKGNTLDEIKRTDFNTAIAYENFVSKGDTIRLFKKGDYYKINGGGRHRVAAAQIYFLRTGLTIPIQAEITENI